MTEAHAIHDAIAARARHADECWRAAFPAGTPTPGRWSVRVVTDAAGTSTEVNLRLVPPPPPAADATAPDDVEAFDLDVCRIDFDWPDPAARGLTLPARVAALRPACRAGDGPGPPVEAHAHLVISHRAFRALPDHRALTSILARLMLRALRRPAPAGE